MLVRRIVNSICLVGVILCGIGIYLEMVTVVTMSIVVAIWIGITTYGVLNMSMNFFLKSRQSNPTVSSKAIAITFDDGPNENTLQILKVLEQYQAKATFFCIGKQVAQYPEVLSKIIAQHHTIGNHTYSHDQLIDIYSTSKFTDEIRKADAILKQYIGKTPRLFRPPYGITNPNIARAVKITGHEVIGWNKRSFDTAIPSEELIFKKITKNIKAGDIILLHDTKKNTVAVLERLLLFLQQHNFRTLTIDELFKIQAYT